MMNKISSEMLLTFFFFFTVIILIFVCLLVIVFGYILLYVCFNFQTYNIVYVIRCAKIICIIRCSTISYKRLKLDMFFKPYYDVRCRNLIVLLQHPMWTIQQYVMSEYIGHLSTAIGIV